MKLLFGGDFAFNSVKKYSFDPNLIRLFKDHAFKSVNLEAPLCKERIKNKISKTGPHLYSEVESSIFYLKLLGIDLVTLANNHIMDFGSDGLYETFNNLEENNIEFVGAGRNSVDASIPFSFERDDIRVCVLNFAENEWASAGNDYPGTNPLDFIDNYRSIKRAKKIHDKVVVIIHGGNEYYPLPSLRARKQYRFYAEQGADAIICHHTHCIGAYEVYNKVPIFYGLGNFLFTRNNKPDSWYKGLLVSLQLSKNEPVNYKVFPVNHDFSNCILKLMSINDSVGIFSRIEKLNSILTDDERLEREWECFIAERKTSYLKRISPLQGIKIRTVRRILLKLGLHKLFYNRENNKELLNRIRCESHKDALLSILMKKIY